MKIFSWNWNDYSHVEAKANSFPYVSIQSENGEWIKRYRLPVMDKFCNGVQMVNELRPRLPGMGKFCNWVHTVNELKHLDYQKLLNLCNWVRMENEFKDYKLKVSVKFISLDQEKSGGNFNFIFNMIIAIKANFHLKGFHRLNMQGLRASKP